MFIDVASMLRKQPQNNFVYICCADVQQKVAQQQNKSKIKHIIEVFRCKIVNEINKGNFEKKIIKVFHALNTEKKFLKT